MKTITVIIADDHLVVREGLKALLNATDDIEVIGEADNGHRAVGEARTRQPHVILMDIAMPLLNGVEAARRITREMPATKVLILSSYSDDQHVHKAINAGVAGFLMKETASTELLRAIREISKGNAFFSPPITRRLAKFWQNRHLQPNDNSLTLLTPRQTETLQLIAEGHSTKQIAGLLFVSAKTVEKHRQALMERLDLHTIATLTRYAVSSGLVEARPYANLAHASQPPYPATAP